MSGTPPSRGSSRTRSPTPPRRSRRSSPTTGARPARRSARSPYLLAAAAARPELGEGRGGGSLLDCARARERRRPQTADQVRSRPRARRGLADYPRADEELSALLPELEGRGTARRADRPRARHALDGAGRGDARDRRGGPPTARRGGRRDRRGGRARDGEPGACHARRRRPRPGTRGRRPSARLWVPDTRPLDLRHHLPARGYDVLGGSIRAFRGGLTPHARARARRTTCLVAPARRRSWRPSRSRVSAGTRRRLGSGTGSSCSPVNSGRTRAAS